MQSPESRLLDIITSAGTDLLCTLPCDRIKALITLASEREGLRHLPLVREEEGVGICAGAALAGWSPAVLIQNSGLGNMVNALMSLTTFYALPLAIFLSHRGVYKEAIEAQMPMGRALPSLLDAMGISYSTIDKDADLEGIGPTLTDIYSQGRTHAFLLSPALWEGSDALAQQAHSEPIGACSMRAPLHEPQPHGMTRYQVLETIADLLKGHPVIANLGIPSKELYTLLPQPSNFYMLGSMGMATPIGLGVAMAKPHKRVFVIDGDGSLLMNPGTLATVASSGVSNLTIIAIDNASYGSTGSQPTLTGACVDLATMAQGLGIKSVRKASTAMEIREALGSTSQGPHFIHILARPGNAQMANIPLDKFRIRDEFKASL